MIKDSLWGLYIHVPFCMNKCLYCDFYSETDLSLIDSWVSSLEKEMEMHSLKCAEAGAIFNSVYFGGGTPSVLGGARVVSIMDAIRKNFRLHEDTEVTVEANPGAVRKNDLKLFLDSGINRINFGVQSFNDDHLRILGRIHSSAQAIEALEASRDAGFKNIGLDIIFAIPGQTSSDLEKDLEMAAGFKPEHISCYSLTYEEGTPIYSSMMNGMINPAADDDAALMFLDTGETLSGLGYMRYEISNFGKTKGQGSLFYSRHNMKYWTHAPYLGLGPAAHSFDGKNKRFWTHRDLGLWMTDIRNGIIPISQIETLTKNDLMTETIFLSLRTCNGLDLEEFRLKYGCDIEKKLKTVIDFYESEGFAVYTSGRIVLAEKGMLTADAITREILYEINL